MQKVVTMQQWRRSEQHWLNSGWPPLNYAICTTMYHYASLCTTMHQQPTHRGSILLLQVAQHPPPSHPPPQVCHDEREFESLRSFVDSSSIESTRRCQQSSHLHSEILSHPEQLRIIEPFPKWKITKQKTGALKAKHPVCPFSIKLVTSGSLVQ